MDPTASAWTLTEDEKLAATLQSQEEGTRPDVSLDAELAAALALEMQQEEEEALDLAAADQEEDAPPPPRSPATTRPVVPPPSPSETVAQGAVLGGVKSMLSRLVASITGDDSEQTAMLERQRRVEAARERIQALQMTVFSSLEVAIPEDCRISGEVHISLPDGTLTQCELDAALVPGDRITVLYEGPELVPYPRSKDGVFDPTAAVDFYRFHPAEVECEQVPVIIGSRCLGGAELVQRAEGVFVQWAVSGSASGLRGGDLVVSVAGEAVETLPELVRFLNLIKLGSRLPVRVLRRPEPVVRCANGHACQPRVVGGNSPAVCTRCEQEWSRLACEECSFALCKECAWAQYQMSTWRFPKPVNPVPGEPIRLLPVLARLAFSKSDVGKHVVVFWFTTCQWWLGEIIAFDYDKGHTVEYAEIGRGKSRETVANFQVREYRLVDERAAEESTAPTAPATFPGAQYDPKEEKRSDSPLIQFEEPAASARVAVAAPVKASEASLLQFDGDEATSAAEATPAAAPLIVERQESPALLGEAESFPVVQNSLASAPVSAAPEAAAVSSEVVFALSAEEQELLKSLGG